MNMGLMQHQSITNSIGQAQIYAVNQTWQIQQFSHWSTRRATLIDPHKSGLCVQSLPDQLYLDKMDRPLTMRLGDTTTTRVLLECTFASGL